MSGHEVARPSGETSLSTVERERLEAEARTLGWALVADVPSEAVQTAYATAHQALDVPPRLIDGVLTRVAAVHPWLARLADAYASFFVRSGLFRTKLVLLLAMLESAPPHHLRFETESTSLTAGWARLVLNGLAALATLVVSIPVFVLPHLFSVLRGAPTESASA